MRDFSDIEARAFALKGKGLESSLPTPATPAQLRKLGDDRYLAEMTACIFRSGFVWRVIETKWPGFEAAFWNFNVKRCAFMSDDDIEALSADTRIVRHGKKILSVRDNARFIAEIAAEHGSFGKFLADWPADDIIGLTQVLKKQGSRLGGNTGFYFLRFVGKDTFMFSNDVVKTLVQEGVVDKAPTSQRDLRAAQDAMNTWASESGRPLCQVSRIMAASQE